MRRHVVNYFNCLYTVKSRLMEALPVEGRFPKLNDSIIRDLVADVSIEEVRRSIFRMSLLKALGVDALHTKFYQANWEIVGTNVFELIRWVFIGDSLDPED